jgi:hypothetical protein
MGGSLTQPRASSGSTGRGFCPKKLATCGGVVNFYLNGGDPPPPLWRRDKRPLPFASRNEFRNVNGRRGYQSFISSLGKVNREGLNINGV